MSTIIAYANLHSIWYMYHDLPNTRSLPKDKMKKWKGEDHLDSSIKQKHKIKDSPFVEGSRGCHALLWLDSQNFNAKERHFILPLVIWTFIMQSVAFITSTSQDRIKLISPTPINHTYLQSNFLLLAPMTTYLKDLTQSIGRYGGLSWQNWV